MNKVIIRINDELNSCNDLDFSGLFNMNQSWRRGYVAGLRRAAEIIEDDTRLTNINSNVDYTNIP